MSLRTRLDRLEREAEGVFCRFMCEDGTEVRCQPEDLLDVFCEVIQAAREDREPGHPLFSALMQAKPGQEGLIDLVHALERSRKVSWS